MDIVHWFRRLERAIWDQPLAQLPVWKKRGVSAVRLAIVLFRDVFDGPLTLWTMSLVYTTLLSMVPLLALSFSVLKAFGVHHEIEPLLANLLAPLGEEGQQITVQLIKFIERMNVGVLGAVGLALLLYTVISLMQKIEESFNAIWHVTRLRSLAERFSRYLSVLLIGPVLVFSALSMTAMAFNSEIVQGLLAIAPLGGAVLLLSKLAPYLLVMSAFTFFYMFLPNTRVRWIPALVAGVVGGALWQSAGWGFAVFVVSSTRYAAIYSSFAILVLFLIWLYVSWLVLLVGAAISFYVQHPEYLYALPGEPRLSNRMRERLALAVMHLVGRRFVLGEAPPTLNDLTERLAVPMHAVDAVLDGLIQGNLLRQTGDGPPAYLPARDMGEVPLATLLAVTRSAGEAQFLDPASLPLPPAIEAILDRIDAANAAALQGITIKSLTETGGDDRGGPASLQSPGSRA